MSKIDPSDFKPGDPMSVIEQRIEGAEHSLGDFSVRRVLPSPQARMVGPFIFFDEFGPAEFDAGHDLGVRAHPHIGLATVSYLFEGAIQHKDSLGFDQRITPGAVNWMVAGQGIVHSERTPDDVIKTGQRLHGLQIWLALPKEHEQTEPSFSHHPADSLPHSVEAGVQWTVVLGSAFDTCSPVPVFSPCFYVDVRLEAGAHIAMPMQYQDRACYPIDGVLSANGEPLAPNTLSLFKPDVPVVLEAAKPSRLIILGGAPLEGRRHLFWNFVASDPALIDRAKDRWAKRLFPTVPGEDEFIPLPD